MEQTQCPSAGKTNPGFGTCRVLRSQAALGVLALMSACAPALAQSDRLLPPENKPGIDGRPWISGFIMLVLLALVLVGAFLKSKRGHQD